MSLIVISLTRSPECPHMKFVVDEMTPQRTVPRLLRFSLLSLYVLNPYSSLVLIRQLINTSLVLNDGFITLTRLRLMAEQGCIIIINFINIYCLCARHGSSENADITFGLLERSCWMTQTSGYWKITDCVFATRILGHVRIQRKAYEYVLMYFRLHKRRGISSPTKRPCLLKYESAAWRQYEYRLYYRCGTWLKIHLLSSMRCDSSHKTSVNAIYRALRTNHAHFLLLDGCHLVSHLALLLVSIAH